MSSYLHTLWWVHVRAGVCVHVHTCMSVVSGQERTRFFRKRKIYHFQYTHNDHIMIFCMSSFLTCTHSGLYFFPLLFPPSLPSAHLPLPIPSPSILQCAQELAKYSAFLYSNEFDGFSNSCLRALDGSNYKVRCSIARLLGTLLSLSQKPLPPNLKGKLKRPSLDEALGVLHNGFVRGGVGFLKAGGAADLLKSGAGASRECRVGVTQVKGRCMWV